MCKIKLVLTLMVLVAVFSTGSWTVVAQEPPPGEDSGTTKTDPPSEEEMAELVARDPRAKYTGVSSSFIVSASGALEATQSTNGSIQGLCIRTPFGPGKVNWNFSNPGAGGAGYSVKPESSGSLIWANPPSQNIDGIYRTSWGSCTALKVPDSCTVTFNNSSSYSTCCNAAMYALGYRVEWVNPCDTGSPEAGWPDYPLQ